MADIESFTYIERATAIVSNILGKNATQEQVIKAVDSVVAINMMGVAKPEEQDMTEPENRARFFVDSCKSFVGVQISQHGDQVALAENEQAIEDSKSDYVGDFNADEVVPT